jgi:hypothetical protein
MAAARSAPDVQSVCSQNDIAYRLAGLTCATILPAVFWIALAAAFAQLSGTHVSASALLVAGAAIAVFLGAVCAPIVMKA